MERDTTLYLYLTPEILYPFPDLDQYDNQLLPLYDSNEVLEIDQDAFKDKF